MIQSAFTNAVVGNQSAINKSIGNDVANTINTLAFAVGAGTGAIGSVASKIGLGQQAVQAQMQERTASIVSRRDQERMLYGTQEDFDRISLKYANQSKDEYEDEQLETVFNKIMNQRRLREENKS